MAYLGLYADDFRYRSLDRAEWAAWRSDVFDARGEASLRLDDLLLLADPEEPGLYLARFTQVLRQHDREVVTTKRLYWRRGDGGAWRIVTEDNG